MRRSVGGLAALSLVAFAIAAVPAPASASRPAAANVQVVKIAVANGHATATPAEVTPGIVEFQVTKNYVIPGKNGGPEAVGVLSTPDLAAFFQAVGPAFAADPGKPKTLAAAAQAMRTVNSIATAYGGGTKGFTWQVRLSAGSYWVLGYQSTAMGKNTPATLTVAGEPRLGALPKPQGIISARGPVGHNRFVVSNLSHLSDGWLRFSNNAHEIHFLDMTGVKPDTTNAMVRKAFTSNGPNFFIGPDYATEVISPGVAIALKPPGGFQAGRYLVACYIPSQTDGMPHAFMGMWRLADVG